MKTEKLRFSDDFRGYRSQTLVENGLKEQTFALIMFLSSQSSIHYSSRISLKPLFPGSNELDQITRIHIVLGTPSPELLNKFKK